MVKKLAGMAEKDSEDVEDSIEISIGDPGWADFGPARGQVIEVFLAETDIDPLAVAWAPFLIVQVSMMPDDGGLVLECKSLGGLDAETDAKLSSAFNRKRGTIHLCPSRPCEYQLSEHYHVTRVRWWRGGTATFQGGSPSTRRQIDKWLNRPAEAEVPRGNGILDAAPKPAPSRRRESARAGKNAVPDGPKEKKKKPAQEEVIDEGKREALTKKLKELKARLRGPAGTAVDGVPEDRDSPNSPHEVDSSPALDELVTGASLVPSGVPGALLKMKKRQMPAGTKEQAALVEASKGSTSKGYQSQLVGRALAVSKTVAGEKRRSSSSGGNLGAALAKILTRQVKKGQSKKQKKKEKKHRKSKKKKRKRDPTGSDDGEGDGDSSPSPSSSGVTDSCDEFSDDLGSSSKSSDDELEAPLKKKSKKNPGSVLELLVSHAREQLDQSASVGVGKDEGHYLTSGIKVMTYFQVLLKPRLGGSAALQREMHHLATAIDLLRQGRLGLLGDTLAARFLCLHQSILDGNWSAAKHLEIFPMEEGSATSAGLLLRTRKHARLAAKAQGQDGGPGYWIPYGRNPKGKGKQEWSGGDFREQKGKGKKGGKGRGKNKQGNWYQGGDKHADQEWKENKEGKSDK